MAITSANQLELLQTAEAVARENPKGMRRRGQRDEASSVIALVVLQSFALLSVTHGVLGCPAPLTFQTCVLTVRASARMPLGDSAVLPDA